MEDVKKFCPFVEDSKGLRKIMKQAGKKGGNDDSKNMMVAHGMKKNQWEKFSWDQGSVTHELRKGVSYVFVGGANCAKSILKRGTVKGTGKKKKRKKKLTRSDLTMWEGLRDGGGRRLLWRGVM